MLLKGILRHIGLSSTLYNLAVFIASRCGIDTHSIDEHSNFTLGWICPIYKKKDLTEISNYRSIMLLNTDYKLLTKALALQLMDNIHVMVHPD